MVLNMLSEEKDIKGGVSPAAGVLEGAVVGEKDRRKRGKEEETIVQK